MEKPDAELDHGLWDAESIKLKTDLLCFIPFFPGHYRLLSVLAVRMTQRNYVCYILGPAQTSKG